MISPKNDEADSNISSENRQPDGSSVASFTELRVLKAIFSRKKIIETFYSFSKIERRFFLTFAGIFVVCFVGILIRLNTNIFVSVPAYGGKITEGVMGAPRFINPLLAISDADRDLTQLVYSGLMRATPEGNLIPDLAENFTITDNGRNYTFTLREGLTWHDGEPITSEDVIFTISKVQDSALKSPKRASWEGVIVEKIDNKTVRFNLPQPYSPFLENTTLGILPSHIWSDISTEQFGFSTFNIEPVGSGPFRIRGIKKDGASGVPVSYELRAFKNFSLGRAYVEIIKMQFYANEDELLRAFEHGEIESINAIRAEKAWELEHRGARVLRFVLPRVFGAFLNQNQNAIFANNAVRKALSESIDRDTIIKEALSGYATPLYGPLPPGALGYAPLEVIDNIKDPLSDSVSEKQNNDNVVDAPNIDEEAVNKASPKIEEAIALLERDGWLKDEETGIRLKKTKKSKDRLSFSIATSDVEELKRTAELLKSTWELLGASVELKIFNAGDLNQNVIRSRKYDVLFFGEIIGRESDPFPFWHSSQRNDPGLNIALYTNITADKLLEGGRTSFEREDRLEIYQKFEKEVRKDTPAIFVYSPDFLYIIPEKLKGIHAGTITVPSERFIDVYQWYIETDRVWKFFIKEIDVTSSN